MQTFAMTIQKLPGGGYVMGYALDGEAATSEQAHAACSTLQEVVQRFVLPKVQDHFSETAVAYARPFPMPPAMSEPLGPPANGHDPDLPSFVQKHNGHGHHLGAFVGAMMIATVWFSTQFGGWTV